MLVSQEIMSNNITRLPKYGVVLAEKNCHFYFFGENDHKNDHKNGHKNDQFFPREDPPIWQSCNIIPVGRSIIILVAAKKYANFVGQ